jgi:K+-transporting ATPase ATPase A chain
MISESVMVVVLAIGLGWPLGHYLAAVMRGKAMRGDRLFLWLERPLYALLGTDPQRGMSWRGYAGAFVLSNLVLGLVVWLLLMTQAWLPFNPNHAANMRWDLALHTMVSFLTNTNQQHYAGQAQLSLLAQMVGVISLQMITPMMGLALVAATLRGLFGGRNAAERGGQPPQQQAVDVGNYWADVLRPSLRVMLPLCLLYTLLLTSQGVPATLQGGPLATPIDASAGMREQQIPLGPVAPMLAIKQLGTNGGYGANSAAALENPTPLSNLLETLALILLPVATALMVGPFTGRRRFGALVFATMLTMSLLSTGLAVCWKARKSAWVPMLRHCGRR